MPSCCILHCGARNRKNQPNLTFHKFPRNEVIKKKWTEAIGIRNINSQLKKWQVCSLHFEETCFNRALEFVRLRENSVPTLRLGQMPDLGDEDSTGLEVCRLCLITDVKMFNIADKNLFQIYTDIVGINIIRNNLSQKICWECTQRLVSAHNLRCKAIRSHNILWEMLQTNKKVTINDLKEIDRTKNKLSSNLTIDHTHGEILFPHVEVKVEINYDDNIVNGNDSDYNEYRLKVDVKCESVFVDGDFNDDLKDSNNDGMGNDNDSNSKDSCFKDTDLNPNKMDDTNEVSSDVNGSVDAGSNKSESDKIDASRVKEASVEGCDKLNKEEFGSEDNVTLSVIRKDKEESQVWTRMEKDNVTTVGKSKPRSTNEGSDKGLLECFTITSLTLQEQIDAIKMRENCLSYKYAVYQCKDCFTGFQVKNVYISHVRRHNEVSGAHQCEVCKKRLTTKRALRKHMVSLHTNLFTCKNCPFTTKNRGVASRHMEWHAGTIYKCEQCPSEFDKISTYLNHVRILHASEFVCEYCGFMFVSQFGLDGHKKKVHTPHDLAMPLEGPHCEVCKIRFVSEEAYQRHVKLSPRHGDSTGKKIRNDTRRRDVQLLPGADTDENDDERTDTRAITCEQCGIEVQGSRAYQAHFMREHPDKNRTNNPSIKKPFMCEACGKIFQCEALLRDHRWTHSGEKTFDCEVCGKSFRKQPLLRSHSLVHNASRPTYQCDQCGKRFSSRANCSRHKLIHTGIRPHKCEKCGKAFLLACEMRTHMDYVHLKKPWPKRYRGKQKKVETAKVAIESTPGAINIDSS